MMGWERGERGERGRGMTPSQHSKPRLRLAGTCSGPNEMVRTARGLSFLADDIVDRFHKVAVSKHRVSQEEQTVIDDQFFRHSFVYPDFTSLDSGLQEFIAADLIDISLRNSLEKTSESPQSLCVCVCVCGGGQVFLEDIYSQGCIQRGGGGRTGISPTSLSFPTPELGQSPM